MLFPIFSRDQAVKKITFLSLITAQGKSVICGTKLFMGFYPGYAYYILVRNMGQGHIVQYQSITQSINKQERTRKYYYTY